jgi:hypothetical protein
MSNKDEIKDKPVDDAINIKPEDRITDDLNDKPVEGQVQEKACETPLKAGEAAVKADKATG